MDGGLGPKIPGNATRPAPHFGTHSNTFRMLHPSVVVVCSVLARASGTMDPTSETSMVGKVGKVDTVERHTARPRAYRALDGW